MHSNHSHCSRLMMIVRNSFDQHDDDVDGGGGDGDGEDGVDNDGDDNCVVRISS